ncbi:gamma-glutamyltransferase [Steroidobacter cummioxidans]|uniref:gamma-glutamyltransferase n=1 Tax=Steroidobacter cummioxidans TaxID=1803913 RepID=UPI00137ACB29|nr:gamma-glutamyltransferase [Steroidobacter cummioxidans]
MAQAAQTMEAASPKPSYHGMITATTGSKAIEGGVEILKAGGSAADAAVATALTQICLAAGSWVSYAGILTMVYFDASTGKVYNLNAGYNTVKAETDAKTLPGVELAELLKDLHGGSYEPSGRTALVPGFMAGVEAAQRRFGKVPFAKVFEPAIDCAEQGFEWNAGLAGQYAFRREVLGRLPQTKAVYTKADGSAYQPGETFKQPMLAKTLRHVAHEGAAYMYRGEWAKKFIDAVQRDGGRMTLDDLASYQPLWTEPMHTSYHGYDIYVHGLPANGGVNLVEAMNLAEVSEVSKLGRYAQSPRATFTLAQILKPAEFFDLVLTDPKIYESVGLDRSLEARAKKESAAKLWDVMRSGRMPTVPAIPSVPAHSDAIISIDRWGNIAAICHSINAVSWGATGINVDGISIPDSASFQRAEIGKVTPGGRLPDPSSPGLVVAKGKPFLGFSSIGAGLHARTVTALISVLDFGMTPQQAINEPSLGSFTLGADGASVLTLGKNEFKPEFISQVEKLGQPLMENDQLRGYWIGVQIDQKTGELHGGAIRELAMGGRAVGY